MIMNTDKGSLDNLTLFSEVREVVSCHDYIALMLCLGIICPVGRPMLITDELSENREKPNSIEKLNPRLVSALCSWI